VLCSTGDAAKPASHPLLAHRPHCRRIARFVSSPSVTNVTAGVGVSEELVQFLLGVEDAITGTSARHQASPPVAQLAAAKSSLASPITHPALASAGLVHPSSTLGGPLRTGCT
jgi:hypothetical protein